MNRPHGNRARLGAVLLAAAAILAMLALPGVAASHDHHHEGAGDAGTIQSFDPETGTLIVALAKGGSVSGLVTPRTHIRCDEHGHHGHRHDGLRHRGHAGATASRDGSGSEHGGRGPGGENPGRGEEPGEDPPGHDGTPPGNSEDPGEGAEHSARCTTEDLVAGATVQFAELVLFDGNAFYKTVGLAPSEEVTATS
jgi:hypothetical protein